MTETNPLKDRTAIVTGASSGIGRAIALTLGTAGAHVFLAGRTREPMDATRKRIEEAGGAASVVVTDLRDPGQVRALVDEAVRETGRLDVMVNNAGLSYPAKIVDGDPEEWRAMLETNLLALLVGCQAAVRAMRDCKAEGHIVNISSIAAQRQDPGIYGATKHAVNAISATLRTELEEDSIRVVNVMPGAIATNFARNFDPAVLKGIIAMSGVEVEVKQGERLPDEVFEKLAGPMKQMLGDPQDVADAVLFSVTQPINVNIADISVRPPKHLDLG
ncbi:MAG: SDR family oxidoreductase [Deltaproteobacteria bacterium]|nr:SDR family oxidoreductase [Deltaproteobacteria bacterium]MBW2392635.1 SDR family oxidoreductase [Deltaproteobacteria bacterium]